MKKKNKTNKEKKQIIKEVYKNEQVKDPKEGMKMKGNNNKI